MNTADLILSCECPQRPTDLQAWAGPEFGDGEVSGKGWSDRQSVDRPCPSLAACRWASYFISLGCFLIWEGRPRGTTPMLGVCIRITWDLVKIRVSGALLVRWFRRSGRILGVWTFCRFPRRSWSAHQCWRAPVRSEPQGVFQLKRPFMLQLTKPGVRKHRR